MKPVKMKLDNDPKKPPFLNISREGQGEAISLLHGWGMNSAVFKPLSSALSNEYAVSRVDLPGYGMSDWYHSGESYEDLWARQLDLMSEQIPDSSLMAWSMGGLYAMKLVNRYPDRYKRLILVASNPCFVQRDDWSSAVESWVFTGFADDFIDNWPATIRRFLGLQMHGVDDVRNRIRMIAKLLVDGGAPNPDALRFGLELLLNEDAREELRQLKVPVMVILGNRDKLVPISLATELSQINPRIRVECLAHSAHAPFLSHLEDFAGLISEFVKPSPPR